MIIIKKPWTERKSHKGGFVWIVWWFPTVRSLLMLTVWYTGVGVITSPGRPSQGGARSLLGHDGASRDGTTNVECLSATKSHTLRYNIYLKMKQKQLLINANLKMSCF